LDELSNKLIKNKKFYYTEGRIGYEFFNEYIKSRLDKYSLKNINEFWKGLENDDKYLEIKTIYFKGMNLCYYTELILLDVDSKYIPVLIENINTSSPYCLEKNYWELDLDDEDSEEKYIKLKEINHNLFPIFNKEKFTQLIGELLCK